VATGNQIRLQHGKRGNRQSNKNTAWQKGQQTVKQDYSMAKWAIESQSRLQHGKRGKQESNKITAWQNGQ
jgi:hypothetical protein